jgi:antimicrobial peptide system SdpA family protein
MSYGKLEANSAARFGLSSLLAIGLVVAAVAFVIVGALPDNPVSPPWSKVQHLSFIQLIPEGWAFFTKSQRDPYFEIYARGSDGRWEPAFFGPQSSVRNAFGILRTPRAQGVEYGWLSTHANAKRKKSCEADFQSCVKTLATAQAIDNPYAAPLICGDVVFVERNPVPWSWATFSHVTMSASYERLHVTCR